IVMFWLVVVVEMMTPLKIYICITCLILLFSETAFGICIGCWLHNLIRQTPATLCPGGVCEVRSKEDIQRINWLQTLIALASLAVVGMLSYQASNV
ncbi:MAG: hypothetical protein RL122_2856, partial [Pseudomonadota bacterium]